MLKTLLTNSPRSLIIPELLNVAIIVITVAVILGLLIGFNDNFFIPIHYYDDCAICYDPVNMTVWIRTKVHGGGYVFKELGKIPKNLPILGTLAGLSQILSAGLGFKI